METAHTRIISGGGIADRPDAGTSATAQQDDGRHGVGQLRRANPGKYDADHAQRLAGTYAGR